MGPITRRFFQQAGVVEGLRVLDVGSGAGDTAFLAAELVGERGEVIGTDCAPAAIAAASARAATLGLRNVTFRQGDTGELSFDRPFDAVVGRYVMLFQADPAAMVLKLSKRLRPGGVMVFHEPTWEHVRSVPRVPIYDACCGWISDTLKRTGSAETGLEVRLHRAFVDAGLPAPSMRLESFIGGGAECMDWLEACAELVISLLPAMEQSGVATAAEVGAATLVERLRREVSANGSLIIGRTEIGVWSRLPQ